MKELLTEAYIKQRRALIKMDRANPNVGPGDAKLTSGDTTYLTVADKDVETEFKKRNEKVKLAVVNFPADKYREGTTAAEVSAALVHRPTRLLSVGVPRRFLDRYGTSAQHDAALGLDVHAIRERIRAFTAA